MKQVTKKIAAHGKRCVHSSIFLPVIALTIFSFVDLPLFSMAQEIKMSTPIIRTYKVAQVVTEAATVVPPMIQTTVVVPATEAPPTTATEIKTEPILIAPNVVSPTTMPPPPPIEPYIAPTFKPQDTSDATKPDEPISTTTAPAPVSGGASNMVSPWPNTSSDGGDNKPQPIKGGVQFIADDDDGMEIEFVDPKEVKMALNDLKKIQSELKRFLKQVKKLPNSADDAATINELLTQAVGYYKNISAPAEDMSLREALQEFWDARLWDEVNVIRAKVELPKELANIAKDLKKAKKLITQKAYTNLGLDISVVSGALTEVETAYNEAKANYDQGNMEDAQLAMEPIHSGFQPGEIMGVLYQMKEIKDRMKGLKNKEVKAIVDELLVDVIDSANAGNFRDANQAMNEIKSELMKIMQKYMKSTVKMDEKTKAKFDKLEEMMEKKLGGEKKMDPKDEVME